MRVVRTVSELESVERILTGQRRLVFDLETSGLAWYRDAQAIGAAFGAWIQGNLQCWYVPFRHLSRGNQIQEEVAVAAIGRILRSVDLTIGHNLKFDAHFSHREGWVIGQCYDTMVAGVLYNENLPMDLEERAHRHLGLNNTREWKNRVQAEIRYLAKTSRLNKTPYLDLYGYAELPVNLCGLYACHDALHTGLLYEYFEKKNVSGTYTRIWPTEMALVRVLEGMERHGLAVDIEYVHGLRHRLLAAREQKGKLLAQAVGNSFRPGSDPDVQDLIYRKYKIPIEGAKRTKGGGLAVDSEVLQALVPRLPVLQTLLEWREADKLATTYTDSILKRTDSNDVCHPDFWQVGTNTGRMSCRSPNFQNMPTDDAERAKANGGVDPWSIRRAFVVRNQKSDRPWIRLAYDYSQIELRVLAYYSKDPILLDVYANNGDVHARTQQEVQAVLQKDVKRRTAKMVNFGLSYGLAAKGLARRSGMSEGDAKLFYEAFESRYQGIVAFRRWFWEEVRHRNGCWFANLWGRRRRVPRLASADKFERGRAERQAIGTLIQGQAAELTKESLVRVDRLIRERGLPAGLCNVVHDDIQIDCDPEALIELALPVKHAMECYPEFDPVPIKVDGEYSTTSWSQKNPLPI